jgi:two-component system, LuxR family, response regulator FixJ
LAESSENGFPIYIVDDDAFVRDGLAFMLEARDREARPFASGRDFLAALPQLPPGAVLLDVRMPDLGGFDVLRALKAEGVTWPVIMMTGHGDAGYAAAALREGAIDLLQKPFREELLQSAMEAAQAMLARSSAG